MNHTGVNTSGLSQVVKDEVNRFLDATEIGTNEEFIVCATEVLTQHEFESRGYCRVPCTIGKAYIKQYVPRNHHKIYRFAYMTTLDANGNVRSPFYRVIKLKSQLSYPHPSGEALYTFTIDAEPSRLQLNLDSGVYMPMSNALNSSITAVYRGESPRADYTYSYSASPYVRGVTIDGGYNSWMAAGDWNLR